jgi:hypothetical protein
VPRLCGFYPGICLTTEEKARKNIRVKRRKDKWIGYSWRGKCFLKHAIEGKIEGRIEVTVRRGRQRKLLLDDLK